jgi:hypothetical protein
VEFAIQNRVWPISADVWKGTAAAFRLPVHKNAKGRFDKRCYVQAVCSKFFGGAQLLALVTFYCGPGPQSAKPVADELLVQACGALGEDNMKDFEVLAHQAEEAVATERDRKQRGPETNPREQRGRTPAHVAGLIPSGVSGCYVTERMYVRQYQGFFPDAFV